MINNCYFYCLHIVNGVATYCQVSCNSRLNILELCQHASKFNLSVQLRGLILELYNKGFKTSLHLRGVGDPDSFKPDPLN